ncbi:MAG: glycosyltransferase 87 family protein [Candidatus Hodarchaeota archaeon]
MTKKGDSSRFKISPQRKGHQSANHRFNLGIGMNFHLGCQKKIQSFVSSPRQVLLSIAVLHLIVLVACALDYYALELFISNYNDGQVSDQHRFVLRGKKVLSGYWPYEGLAPAESLAPPLSTYILAVPLILETYLFLPLAFIYRFYFSLFNLITCWMLIRIGEKQFPEREKSQIALFYGTSPFLLWQATGADECIGAFFMVLVVYLLMVHETPFFSAIAIGIGTAAKYYPCLLIPYVVATRTSRKEKIKVSITSVLAILFSLLPFFLAQPNGFMNQFEVRIGRLPWDAGGNNSLVILLARMQWLNIEEEVESFYRILWISLVVAVGLFQILKGMNAIETAALVPSIFFIVFPKFFFSYFLIVFPFFCMAFVRRHSSVALWCLVHASLISGQAAVDRVVGYGSVWSQLPGQVPFLLAIGIAQFFVIWLFLWGLILMKRDFELDWSLPGIIRISRIVAGSK